LLAFCKKARLPGKVSTQLNIDISLKKERLCRLPVCHAIHHLSSFPTFISIEVLIHHLPIILQRALALSLLHLNRIRDAVVVLSQPTSSEAHFLQHGKTFAVATGHLVEGQLVARRKLGSLHGRLEVAIGNTGILPAQTPVQHQQVRKCAGQRALCASRFMSMLGVYDSSRFYLSNCVTNSDSIYIYLGWFSF